MESIRVQDAVGMVLGHDITEIRPGDFKGPYFRKGHVIQRSDIEKLLDLGKRHIYVLQLNKDQVHENEAAKRIAKAATGPGLTLTDPSEGKVTLSAEQNGLLKVDAQALLQINQVQDMMFATLHSNQQVAANQPVAGTRIIPLVTDEARIRRIEAICRSHFPIIQVKPFIHHRVGLIVTGSEVFEGRIVDGFGPVVEKKFLDLGSHVIGCQKVSDDIDMTVQAIHSFLNKYAQIIAVTGGMSVDPDDQTPASIRAAGGQVVAYGAPVLPGAMFMLAHIQDIPVIGLPGCVMYHQTSIFDLVVPRILAGETVNPDDIVAMGHGGFCSDCATCRYPICPFGK
jgi:probable molybdopterin binding protein